MRLHRLRGFVPIFLFLLLGACTPDPQPSGQPTPPPPSGVHIPAAGGGHSCASLFDGTLKCWGDNRLGQLGDATNNSTRVPVFVAGRAPGPVNRGLLLGIAAGDFHTCEIGTVGQIFCWGNNSHGQLGLDSKTDFNSMQPVRPVIANGVPRKANLIAAGQFHTCAVYDPDAVACWGKGYGLKPTHVAGVSAQRIAAGGDQTCVIAAGGVVRCWTSLPFNQPPILTTIVGVSAQGSIAVGGSHACAIDQGGQIRCWGSNLHGQRGSANTPPPNGAVVVTPVSTSAVTELAAGDSHTCALFASGAVECWGANGAGQTGDPASSITRSPRQVIGSGATAIVLGGAHSCARMANGPTRWMECWGSNATGQLGDGSNSATSLTPVRVTALP